MTYNYIIKTKASFLNRWKLLGENVHELKGSRELTVRKRFGLNCSIYSGGKDHTVLILLVFEK